MKFKFFAAMATAFALACLTGCESKDKEDSSNLYVEPYMVWGATQSNIIQRYGDPHVRTVTNLGNPVLLYGTTDAGAAEGYGFFFDGSETEPEGLIAVAVWVKSTEKRIRSFLGGKYTDYQESAEEVLAIYGDHPNEMQATKLILLTQDSNGDYEVIYADPNASIFTGGGEASKRALSLAVQAVTRVK
jgi:hypothetical protein